MPGTFAAPPRRAYRQTARAAGVAQARARELVSTVELVLADGPRSVSLAGAAAAAGTTVPTLLRHFGSRDALVAEALELALVRIRRARPGVAPGDARGAARVLGAEYEQHAELLRAAAEHALASGAELEAPRRLHRDWVARTFTGALSPLPPLVHRLRLAQLATASSSGAWRTLRSGEHLGPPQAQAALAATLLALTGRAAA